MAKKKEIKPEHEREIPEKKKKLLEEIIGLINKYNTTMIALTENMSSAQFQKLKKTLNGKAIIKVVKKNLVLMALEKSKETKFGVHVLEKNITANIALVFSELDAFELAGILAENKVKAFVRPGQTAREDLVLEAGPTDLPAGPVISELAKANLKAGIEGGKIAIKERSVLAKKGQIISDDAANVLAKLEIMPLSISLLPIAAYDSKTKQIYENIRIDKEATITEIATISGQSFNFAMHINYICSETIKFLLAKANSQFNALQGKIPSGPAESEPVQQNNVQNPENKLNAEENK